MDQPVSESGPSTPTGVAPGFAAATVTLRPRKARPFFGRHPWVLDTAIQSIDGDPADGDLVDLLSENGRFIARGMLNHRSRIRVRLYTWQAAQAISGLSFFPKARATCRSIRRQHWWSAWQAARSALRSSLIPMLILLPKS